MPNNNLQDIKNALSELETAAAENSIGKMIASSIGVGIDQNSYLAVTAMENVYVELETLYKNAAKNAEALEKKHHKRVLDNLKNSLELNLISEQEYYEKLKAYRDQNFRQGTDDWYKYTEEIIFYNKRLADEAQKQQEQIASIRNKLLSQIQSVRDELSEKLQMDDVDWFSTNKLIFKGMGERGRDLIYNVSDVSAFEKETALVGQYRDAILSLKDLGNIPDGVFADIAKMSVEDGLAAANAILNADTFKRDRFITGYNNFHSLADNVASELLPLLGKEEIENAALDAANAFNKAFFNTDNDDKTAFITMLEDSFASVPDSYYTLGDSSAYAFKDGFMQNLPEIMSSIQSFIQGSINSLVSGFATAVPSYAGTAVSGNNTYNNNYVFNSSRDTTTQQLFAAQRASLLSRLRGATIYDVKR